MRLIIESSQGHLDVDFDFKGGREAQKSENSESATIELNLGKEKEEALKAVYALRGHEPGPVFWAIQDIAAEAFKAGQKMTKFIQQ